MSEEGKSSDKQEPGIARTPAFGDPKTAKPLRMFEATRTEFSGPIPPPAMLEQYNKIIPNAAELILGMAVAQSNHRQSIERTVVEGGAQRAQLGLILGFILALVALLGSMFLIYSGRDISGLALFITSLVGLIGVFVYQTKEREKERLARSATRAERQMVREGER